MSVKISIFLPDGREDAYTIGVNGVKDVVEAPFGVQRRVIIRTQTQTIIYDNFPYIIYKDN